MGLALGALVLGALSCQREPGQKSETEMVRGHILEVEAKSLLELGKLIIQDEDGELWSFGEQQSVPAQFTPSHLRDHMVQGLSVTVTFHRKDGFLVIDDIAD